MKNLLKPGSEHRLKKIQEGEYDRVDNKAELFQYMYAFQDDLETLQGIIAIDKPTISSESLYFQNEPLYLISLRLTDLGMIALPIISKGYVFNIQNKCIDYEETEKYHRRILEYYCVTKRNIKIIMDMNDPELQSLRSFTMMQLLTMTLSSDGLYYQIQK